MRYIGSKANLVKNIENCITQNIRTKQKSFCDIFSGTGVVARYFKPQYEIISNDALFFSYIIQKAYVENNGIPSFKKLKTETDNPFFYLENFALTETDNKFVFQNYSPAGESKRMYFTEENARRIDFIRTTVERWKTEKKLTEAEYYYLLASLIEAVPSVSNITGTYGAYLKNWDKRAFKKLELPRFNIEDNGKQNRAYNEDVFDLEKHVSGDILYIDPPYNSRQYAPNYHVLETIARYDNPQLSGVTGMRPYENQKSVFCSKHEVNDAFAQLIKDADFSHIVMSYSSSGLMKADFIEKILKDNGIASTFTLQKIPYRKYKSKIYDESGVCEYLFYIQKKAQNNLYAFEYKIPEDYGVLKVAEPSLKYTKYIKSPLNYIGGKYKLLPQLMPLLPKNINTFVDLFCGGCNVGINMDAKKIVFNDLNTILTDMFKAFKETNLGDLLSKIESIISEWHLSMTNEEAFVAFRDHYNQTRDPIELYVLSCYSFNYQFRFNNNHEYNNPFGRNRSQFSETMKAHLIQFVNKMKASDVEFTSFDFTEYPIDALAKGDFVYSDPPYLITTGSYNDGNRGFKNWNADSDRKLYALLDRLNEKGIRFALSNVFTHKGERNDILIEWAKKYTVHHLNMDYSNASYNTARTGSDEVLVTNYEVKE